MRDIRKSVKTKLGLGFGLTIALVCVLGAVALIAVVRMAAGTVEIYDKNLQGITAITQTQQVLSHLQAEIRDRLHSGTPGDLAALAKDIPKAQKRITQAWDRYYPARITTASEKQIAKKAYAQLQKTGPVLAHFSTMAAKMDFNDAAGFYKTTQFFKTTLTKTLQDFSAKLNQLQQIQLTAARQAYQQTQASALRMKITIAGVALAVLALLLVTAFLLTRMITRPLREARGFVQRIADGNLQFRQNTAYRDEFGATIDAIEAMRSRLADVVHGVRDSSDSVSIGAGQIASGNDELSHRTQEQAANLEETAASMEQMTATVKQNADNAAQADQLAQGVRRQAGEGSEVVARAVASMQAIDAASQKITDIVGLIDDIAFQTNLLALNASVEAARAGEQGRGFAVVASEVRNLASRSAAAAKDIKALVEDSAAKVAEGSREVALSGTTLEEIVASVNKVSDIVAEIAAASKEQSGGIEQVNTAITQMDSMTQQNASLVEQSTAASRSLQEQSEELRHQVAFFRLQNDDADTEKARDEAPAADTVRSGAVPLPTKPAASEIQPKPVTPAPLKEEEWATF